MHQLQQKLRTMVQHRVDIESSIR